MANTELKGYELSRNFFDWCFENPELINPSHSAIYFFAIEHCNRLGWKSKFGFPTQMVMDAIGIKKHETYIRYLNDLIGWGFLILIQKSTNQYSANIISISNAVPKNGKALEKASLKHGRKQIESMGESTRESKGSILKQENKETEKQINTEECYTFEMFWNEYGKKVDNKKCEAKWKALSDKDKSAIKENVTLYVQSTPDIQYRKNPLTYLNGQCWKDEILQRIPAKLNPPNYNPSFERWDGVKRWCGNIEIPYDAPPKPSNMEKWNNEKQQWIYSNF